MVFDAANRYAQRLVEVLGMQSMQALSLFNQTMGIKVLGDLNEFIRTNMLEPKDMEQEFQALKKHLGPPCWKPSAISRKMRRADPPPPSLKKAFISYREQAALATQARQQVETAKVWRPTIPATTSSTNISGCWKKTRRQQKPQSEELRQQMEALRDEIRTTQNQLEQNKAGQRLHQLEKEKEHLLVQEKEAAAALAKFSGWCAALKLEETQPADEAAYQRIRKEAERSDKRLATEIRNNEEDLFETQDRQNKVNGERQQLETELNILRQSRNNIPAHLVSLRQGLCAALGLDEQELPFAGELMQVRGDALDWQPALEKLLHPFALRLLVPDKYYRKVNKYVNSTDLNARLVYNLVKAHALHKHSEDGTVWHKLEFHPEHPLGAWVSQQVIQQYDYSCAENEKTFERFEKAITLQGLTRNRDRHEKDDRPGRAAAGRFVMGWNNEKRRRRCNSSGHSSSPKQVRRKRPMTAPRRKETVFSSRSSP